METSEKWLVLDNQCVLLGNFCVFESYLLEHLVD